MQAKHLGHVAIRCSDLERSLAFYTKLGLHEAFRLERPDGGGVSLVYLRIDDTSFLELFPNGTEPPASGPRQLGYAHCCLLVDDIQAAYRDCVAQGVPTNGEPKMGRDGNWQFWITDPDGTRLEVMQIMPDSLQARSIRQVQPVEATGAR